MVSVMGFMKRPWLGRMAPSETGALELYAELLDGRAITPVQSLRHLFDKLLQSVVTESLRILPVKSAGMSGSKITGHDRKAPLVACLHLRMGMPREDPSCGLQGRFARPLHRLSQQTAGP